MINLMTKYALDIPAILECVDHNYRIHTFFDKWEVTWALDRSSGVGKTIREALANFKVEASKYIDPELG